MRQFLCTHRRNCTRNRSLLLGKSKTSDYYFIQQHTIFFQCHNNIVFAGHRNCLGDISYKRDSQDIIRTNRQFKITFHIGYCTILTFLSNYTGSYHSFPLIIHNSPTDIYIILCCHMNKTQKDNQ